jgi:tRNA G18 (ribose-2'-O)-methylase SpoU
VPISIDDAGDPRIDDYVGLRDRKESQRFLIAETPVVVERLVASALEIRSFLFTPAAWERMEPVVGGVDAPVYLAERDVMERITGFDVHRGVLASAERPRLPGLLDVAAEGRRIVVLEGSNDHENIGAVARCARALGYDALVLDPTCSDPYYRRCIRVSMGEILHLPVVRLGLWPDGLDMLAHLGFELWSLTPDPAATSLYRMGMPDKVALVAGAEGHGLSPAVRSRTHYDVRIPMHRGVDSLNLSHALAIAMAATSPGLTD